MEVEVDFVMPVYNERENISRALAEVDKHVSLSKRLLLVYDSEEDTTLPVVRAIAPLYPWAQLVKNTRGSGVLNAIRCGIEATTAEVVIITMADLSDDLRIVPEMVRLIRCEGYDIVCASRYMQGGVQIGGPRFKGFLSRWAGQSLHWLTGLPTHDATNAFRAYRREVLLATTIESRGGFEYSLEITAKAHAAGRRITEIPSRWCDRAEGKSRFRLFTWLPHYFRWYLYALMHQRRKEGQASLRSHVPSHREL